MGGDEGGVVLWGFGGLFFFYVFEFFLNLSFFPCLSPRAASGPRKEERTHHSVEVVPGEDEIVLHTLANGLLEEPEVLAHGVGRALEPGLLLSLKRERKRKEEVRGEKEEEGKKNSK